MKAQGELVMQRQALEQERTVLQQQILEMEQTMDRMYTNILRKRRQSDAKTREDDELLDISTRNDKLISRYYALTERIAELDLQLDNAKP